MIKNICSLLCLMVVLSSCHSLLPNNLLGVNQFFGQSSKPPVRHKKTRVVNRQAGNNQNVVSNGRVLTRVIRAHGAQSANGRMDQKLCRLALDHAHYMSRQGRVSHDNFRSHRARVIQGSGIGSRVSEIVAMRKGGDVHRISEGIYNAWLNSAGHRPKMLSYHRAYCYTMIYNPQTQWWYAVGLFAD